ncbi:MAG: hypothetical protein SGI94_10265 [Saprospiraceae bacterium]|nr:hypothetical protein [Saprospiraceae bacterium]
MTIKEVFSALENATHPVARALHKGSDFKVMVIGFKKGMILKEHLTKTTTKLTILSGNVIYREGEKQVRLAQYEEVNIPVDQLHSVEALTDSLCLLTQG